MAHTREGHQAAKGSKKIVVCNLQSVQVLNEQPAVIAAMGLNLATRLTAAGDRWNQPDQRRGRTNERGVAEAMGSDQAAARHEG